MAKLFAMEELENEVLGEDLQVAPEEGEVADVQVEVEQEVAEASEGETAIDEGVEAADQLEEVQDVVEQAASDEGEGLDPVAAEAIRIAVEAIAARVGANPKSVFALYATENFQSASSRKANTKIALEGVGEFLKDLIKKIKAALTKLWEKAKAFWEKHVSSLGRVKKALESMKSKVSSSSGKIAEKAHFEEAPSSLVDAFPGTGDISAASVKKYIQAHRDITKSAEEVAKTVDTINNGAEKAAKLSGSELSAAIKGMMGSSTQEISFGSKSAPLVGGNYIVYKFDADKTEGDLTVEVERESIDNKESKLGISVADKSGVQDLIKETLAVITDTVKNKEKFDKQQAAFNKTMLNLEKAVNGEGGKPEAVKGLRKMLSVIYKANAKVPGVSAELIAANVKLAKAVLGFSAFCLKQYK